MATYTKQILSGSVNGRQIPVAVSSSVTEIHTAVAGTTDMDEIYLYVANNNSASVSCSILWGGTDELSDKVELIVNPAQGRTLVVDGKLLQNSLVVSAYTKNYAGVVIDGFVNEIRE
jgi:hypothetical protein